MWSLCLLLLLSCFSRVRLCATPETAAHQVPPSLGFSRQEHWSGLPFPSPMHESEKWKWSSSVLSDSSGPHGLQPTRLLPPWDFPGKSSGVRCHCLLQASLYWPPNHLQSLYPTGRGKKKRFFPYVSLALCSYTVIEWKSVKLVSTVHFYLEGQVCQLTL